jgi:hypothetical protein
MSLFDHMDEEYLEIAEKFRGGEVPGAVAGGFMAHMAERSLPDGVACHAILENLSCRGENPSQKEKKNGKTLIGPPMHYVRGFLTNGPKPTERGEGIRSLI